MASPFYAECLGADGVFKYFKDNQWLSSKSGKSVKINNPTTDSTEFLVQGALGTCIAYFVATGQFCGCCA